MNLYVQRPRTTSVRFKVTPIALLLQGTLGAGLTFAAGAAMGQQAGAQGGNVLQEVVVTGEAEAIGNLQKTYAGGQIARGGDLGLLGRTDQMNVPFSTTNYTSELLQNQQARTMSDVVMNDASVRPVTARGGFDENVQIRGFDVQQDDTAVNGMFGLAPSTNIPLEMIERVEVLKGPGSLTNGVGPNGSIGGAINLVTKRASDTPLTRLTATYMSDAQVGAHLDMGRRFGEDNQWGVRVNTVTRGGEGNIEGGEQNLNLGSLALDYHSRSLRWSLDAWAAHGETKEMRPQASFSGTSIPAPPDGSKSFTPGSNLDDNTRSVFSRLEYDINDSTTVYGGVGYMHNYFQQNLPGASVDANGNFNVQNSWYDEDTKNATADIGARTRFKTGPVSHTLALGANFLDMERGYFYTTSATTNPSNIYDPSALPEITAARLDPMKSEVVKQSSVALADTLAFADDSVLLTLGLRHQRIQYDTYDAYTRTGALNEHYNDSATTPLAGVVFKPVKNVSLYSNYTAGLTRGKVSTATGNQGESFAPQRSKQYEAGVKVDWGKMITQVAVYQIQMPTSITENNVFYYGGEQRNRGLELSAYGEIQRGLRLMASTAFIDAKLTRTQDGTNEGNTATGVPDFNYNLGLDWDTSWVRGLSLNGRVVGTSEMYMNKANTLKMDAWQRFDVGARYATEVVGTPMVLRAGVENVANEKYWLTYTDGYASAGAPRTYMVSATFDF